MNSIRAALLVLAGLGLATLPSAAPAADRAVTPRQCEISTCVESTVTPSPNGWNLHIKISMVADLGYKHFQLQVPGNGQMKVDGPGNVAEVDLPVSAAWDGNFQARACNADLLSERCDSWSTFHAALPVADGDESFCNNYASTATSQGVAAQQKNCGFETTSGRWSTDRSAHLNWCLGQFRVAGGVASKLTAARNVANSEEATRGDALNTCQANAANKQAYADQVEQEIKVTGKTAAECQASFNSCGVRVGNGAPQLLRPGVIATECQPRFQVCLANAAVAEKAHADQLEEEFRVTGKTAAECQASFNSCVVRVGNGVPPLQRPGVIAAECQPRFQVCLGQAAVAAAAAANQDTADSSEESTDASDQMADTSNGDDMAEAPANTARVKRDVNVHNGDVKGKVVGSLSAGTTVEYFDCDKSACRIPFEGDEGFVSKSFLDLGGGGGSSGGFRVEIPLPGKNKVVITTPGAKGSAVTPPIASFAGVWDSKTDKGWTYVITLKQVGRKVTGAYIAQDGSKGTFNGTVAENTFNYNWTADGGYVGSGSFEMTTEGVMDGSYDTTKFPDPDMDDYYKTGTWHAERR